jgi:serine/threonine-protein kinase
MELNPSLPAGLNNIILTALAKDPATRFQTADAFRNALRSLSSTAQAAASSSAAEAASPAIAAAASTGSLGPTVQPPPLPQFSPVDPAPPAETPYTPVAAAVSPQPVSTGGHRGLWIGLGAIAALAAMIAAVTILPHFLSTHANSASNAVSHTPPAQASLPDSMTQPPPLPPQTPVAESGVQVPGTGTPQPPVSLTKPVPGASTVRSPKPSGSIPLSKPPVIAPTAPNAQPTAPSATELGEVEDRLTQVSARAGAARDAIDQIRRQQEADGLGLRTDIASSLSRMNSYLQAANRSFAEHDAASTNKSLDRAEKELETLETFLGK